MQVGLFAVFDGHAGDRAAIFLEKELKARVAALADPTNETQLSQCVQKLDADFLKDVEQREDGSTCTFCVVHPVDGTHATRIQFTTNAHNTHAQHLQSEAGTQTQTLDVHAAVDGKKAWEVIAVNVGDSRSMLIHPDGSIESLTEDHKPETEAENARIRAAGGCLSSLSSISLLSLSLALSLSRALSLTLTHTYDASFLCLFRRVGAWP